VLAVVPSFSVCRRWGNEDDDDDEDD